MKSLFVKRFASAHVETISRPDKVQFRMNSMYFQSFGSPCFDVFHKNRKCQQFNTAGSSHEFNVSNVLNLFEPLKNQNCQVVSQEFNVFRKFQICSNQMQVDQHCQVLLHEFEVFREFPISSNHLQISTIRQFPHELNVFREFRTSSNHLWTSTIRYISMNSRCFERFECV